ncbi:hypothetical protein OG871_02515 [Kitasatospora sp. NBC_00374]|uniref:hypothetical protein n=1 Tax=Kitasatospora sp. NBC_00374 TaxID=2975964 RepID=UPI0030E24AC9
MSREYHFHREHAGFSVTAGVRLGGHRELELLVDGKEVAAARVDGHRAEVRSMTTVLPTDPPRRIDVQVSLPGPVNGDPACVLLADGADGARLPMPARDVPRRARLTEASWYG